MKKRLLIAIVLALVLSLTLAAPASAKIKNKERPLVSLMNMAVPTADHPDTWFGTVSGDINGTLEVGELPSFEGPFLYTFTEWFEVKTAMGDVRGFDMGVWNLTTFQFRASGWVTDATGPYERYIGWMLYEDGYTSDISNVPVTIEDAHFVLAPPLPASWAKIWW
jgi:hypothetical protein